MPNTYRGREGRREKSHPRLTGLPGRLGRLLLKQTAAALICTAVVWGMHSTNTPRLGGYTQALGRALRHESNLSALLQTGEGLKERLSELFSLENDQ